MVPMGSANRQHGMQWLRCVPRRRLRPLLRTTLIPGLTADAKLEVFSLSVLGLTWDIGPVPFVSLFYVSIRIAEKLAPVRGHAQAGAGQTNLAESSR